MTHILDQIVANKRSELEAAKAVTPIEALREIVEPSVRDFRAAVETRHRHVSLPRLIAEFKRTSPSESRAKARDGDPERAKRVEGQLQKIVSLYNDHAAAISVLTDTKFFGGSLEDLDEANEISKLPLLRKDFIFDEYQLLEARQFGADVVLLIARILEADKIENLILEAKKTGLDCLVEVHDEADLEKVLQTSAEIIGINNRNLDTLEIDLQTTFDLVKKIPAEKIIVSESGISSRADVEKLKGKVDAILVGTSILKSENIEAKLIELTQ
jgi:indole-3-glycerol phosphate synthase